MACRKLNKEQEQCIQLHLEIFERHGDELCGGGGNWHFTDEEKSALHKLCEREDMPRCGCIFCTPFVWVKNELRQIMRQTQHKEGDSGVEGNSTE